MTDIIRWGILGCGRIARKFASDMQLVKDGRIVAAGSRSKESVDRFASEFSIPNRHSSYEELVTNPEVDVIYVASPHALHYAHSLLCLEHDKAVLCEKAFAINSREARTMIDLARKKKIFLMEALWTKFTPRFRKMQELIADGRLGELRAVLVNFGFIPANPVPQRLIDPALGGGSLLDIGIYNVFMALSILGKPDEIEASMTAMTPGIPIDAQCAILFRYHNGALAQLFSTLQSNLPTEAEICGNRGRIRLSSRFYEPFAAVEFYPDRVDSRELIPFEKEPGMGYQYEIRHVNSCLKQGLKESPVMSHADSLLLMETLDAIRHKAGIRYEADALQE